MFRRPFSALLGLGVGVTIGVWAVRRLEQAQAQLTPEQLARTAQHRAGAAGARLVDALAAGRAAAAAREGELRVASPDVATPAVASPDVATPDPAPEAR